MDDASGLAIRIGLNASVLVTAILYNNSLLNSIPPTTQLSFWTAFITSVLSFLSFSLIIPILGYVEFRGKKREHRFKQINRWGILFSVSIPLFLFVFLYVLR